MRSLRIATWTSGDPVSPSLVAYSIMSACLRSAVIDTDLTPSAIDDPRRLESAVCDLGQSDHHLVVPDANDRTLVESIQMRPCANIVRRHPLPATQSSSFGCGQGQSRDVVQRGLDWKQILRSSQTMHTLDYGIQRNRLRFGESSDRETPQLGDVAERSECDAEIAGEGPDIGTLADESLAIGVVPIRDGNEPQRSDLHGPRLEGQRCRGARQLIGAASVDLDRRVRWR